MPKFGSYLAGNTILIDRPALIQQLERMLDDPKVEQERQRKGRLSEHLAALEKYRGQQLSAFLSAGMSCI